MGKPPDEQDPRWRDLEDQVTRALEEAGLGGGSLDQALLDAVRTAFDALDELGGAAPGAASSPEVHVMEGGLHEEQASPRPEDARPNLRLAPDPEDLEQDDDEVATDEDPQVRVSVHRLGASPRRRATPIDLRRRGPIAVSEGEAQTIYRGATARLYRVGCARGDLRIEVDGLPTETLTSGQALDVEARLLRVHGTTAATGTYALVKQP